MTIVSSGTLYLGPTGDAGTTHNIRFEILDGYGSYNLLAANTAAGFSLPTGMTDFYSYSHLSVPNAPTGIGGVWTKFKQLMNVSWTNAASGSTPTRTYLYASKNNGVWVIVGTYTTYPTSIRLITGLACGASYKYKARHWNAAGFGPYSADGLNDFATCTGCLLGNHSLMIHPGEYADIKSLKEGDFIYTAHQNDLNHLDYYKISSYEKVPVDEYYSIVFSDGEKIKCSMSHKFMTPHGDMSCEILAQEDSVFKLINGKIEEIKIVLMEVIKEKEFVYKIEVEGAHTYITENNILHHNIKE